MVETQKKEIGAAPLQRAGKLLGNIIFAGILLLMAALVFFLVTSSMTGGPPAVFGHQLYIVLSGSMSPTFNAGGMVVVKPLDPGELKVGDVITFTGADGGDTLITHRIVGINTEDGLSFTTRGDNNQSNDPAPVTADRVVGRVALAIPYAGQVADFAQTKEGLLALVIVPGALIIGFELRNLFRYAAELDRQKEAQQAQPQLTEEEGS